MPSSFFAKKTSRIMKRILLTRNLYGTLKCGPLMLAEGVFSIPLLFLSREENKAFYEGGE